MLIMISLSPVATASLAGWGVVHMGGAIIDSACAIAIGDRDQTINMGTVPISQIVRNGQGEDMPFSVKLVNCVLERHRPHLPDWKYFRVTFDGSIDGKGFGVQGEAEGIVIQITDSYGNIASPGVAMPINEIVPGDMLLNYSFKLIGNNKPLRAGDYFSTIKFKLDYY
nr:fimbrial protein [Serratia inhibens]